jgi:hypothetical protein
VPSGMVLSIRQASAFRVIHVPKSFIVALYLPPIACVLNRSTQRRRRTPLMVSCGGRRVLRLASGGFTAKVVIRNSGCGLRAWTWSFHDCSGITKSGVCLPLPSQYSPGSVTLRRHL